MGSEVTVGSCATGAREPGQAREGAAFIGIAGAPQIAWPSPHSPRTKYGGRMESLETVAPAFVDMAHQIVWATAATVSTAGGPSTRILHPIWEWDGTVCGAGSPPHRRRSRPGIWRSTR